MKQSFRNTVWETPFQSFTQVGFPSSRQDIREIKTLDIKALQKIYSLRHFQTNVLILFANKSFEHYILNKNVTNFIAIYALDCICYDNEQLVVIQLSYKYWLTKYIWVEVVYLHVLLYLYINHILLIDVGSGN